MNRVLIFAYLLWPFRPFDVTDVRYAWQNVGSDPAAWSGARLWWGWIRPLL